MAERQGDATLAGFNDAEDGAEHITTGFLPETAVHFLAVFDYAKITLAEVVVERNVKAPEKSGTCPATGYLRPNGSVLLHLLF